MFLRWNDICDSVAGALPAMGVARDARRDRSPRRSCRRCRGGWIAARCRPGDRRARSVHDRGERRLDAGGDVRVALAARPAVAAAPRVRGRRAGRPRRRPRSQPERPQGEPPRSGARRGPSHGRHGRGPARRRAGGTRTSSTTSPATVCSMSCISVSATTDTPRRGPRAIPVIDVTAMRCRDHAALPGTGSHDPDGPRGQPGPVGDVPRRGAGKSEMVKRLVARDMSIPATHVRADATLLVDESAASAL